METILKHLRTLLIDHMAASEVITANLLVGATTIKILNTSRFRVGDDIFVLSSSVGFAEQTTVVDIPDEETLVVDPPIVRAWQVSETSYVQKAIGGTAIKRIHIGGLSVIPSFPTITLEPTGESNEWYTLRGTNHEFKISIRTYVLADNFEASTLLLPRISDRIREILLDHIHPIIDGEDFLMTADAPANSTVIKVADTSNFKALDRVYLRDSRAYTNFDDTIIKTILDPNFMEVISPIDNSYLVSKQATVTKAYRYLFDSRPESTSYGYSGKGGSLMRASEISWFGKEFVIRKGNVLT